MTFDFLLFDINFCSTIIFSFSLFSILFSLVSSNFSESKFNAIIIDWFKRFSKGKNEMNRADIADCYNTLSGKKENKFT